MCAVLGKRQLAAERLVIICSLQGGNKHARISPEEFCLYDENIFVDKVHITSLSLSTAN